MSEKTAEGVVLDTYAVLAMLEEEPGAARVRAALAIGAAWMTLVNLGEVTYIVERRHGVAAADTAFGNLLHGEGPGGEALIHWTPLDAALVRRAASLKAMGGMSYADCFAAAAADLLGCPVLTGDPEFAVAERAGIAVEWL